MPDIIIEDDGYEKWESIINSVDKESIPFRFVDRIIVRSDNNAVKFDITDLVDEGFCDEEIVLLLHEMIISEFDTDEFAISFVVNVDSVSYEVQKESDKIMKRIL